MHGSSEEKEIIKVNADHKGMKGKTGRKRRGKG